MFIYAIENKLNGEQYIGQTTKSTPEKRFNEHRHYLRKDTHRNRHLQHAWNKDGESSFRFYILKECKNRDELNAEEERLITQRGDYNIAPGGDNTETSLETRIKISKSHRSAPYPKIVDPEGNVYKIEPTLEEFCRQFDLLAPVLRAVIAGRINYCNGWHLTTTKISMDDARSLSHRDEPYPIVIDPNGNEHKISNLRKFCRDHTLGENFRKMMGGKYQQYKGWHIKGKEIIDPNILRSESMKASYHKHPRVRLTPEKVLEIRKRRKEDGLSLRKLAAEYDLPKTTIWNLLNGKTWNHI